LSWRFLREVRIAFGVFRLIANHLTSFGSKTYQKSGSFPPPTLPGFYGTMTLSDSRADRCDFASLKKNYDNAGDLSSS
jgi:hypothetical protein